MIVAGPGPTVRAFWLALVAGSPALWLATHDPALLAPGLDTHGGFATHWMLAASLLPAALWGIPMLLGRHRPLLALLVLCAHLAAVAVLLWRLADVYQITGSIRWTVLSAGELLSGAALALGMLAPVAVVLLRSIAIGKRQGAWRNTLALQKRRCRRLAEASDRLIAIRPKIDERRRQAVIEAATDRLASRFAGSAVPSLPDIEPLGPDRVALSFTPTAGSEDEAALAALVLLKDRERLLAEQDAENYRQQAEDAERRLAEIERLRRRQQESLGIAEALDKVITGALAGGMWAAGSMRRD